MRQIVVEGKKREVPNGTTYLELAKEHQKNYPHDIILVLENGSIVQRGSHQELVAQEGLYRRICTIQNELDEAMEGGVAV